MVSALQFRPQVLQDEGGVAVSGRAGLPAVALAKAGRAILPRRRDCGCPRQLLVLSGSTAGSISALVVLEVLEVLAGRRGISCLAACQPNQGETIDSASKNAPSVRNASARASRVGAWPGPPRPAGPSGHAWWDWPR